MLPCNIACSQFCPMFPPFVNAKSTFCFIISLAYHIAPSLTMLPSAISFAGQPVAELVFCSCTGNNFLEAQICLCFIRCYHCSNCCVRRIGDLAFFVDLYRRPFKETGFRLQSELSSQRIFPIHLQIL